jgi:hypothetical protein
MTHHTFAFTLLLRDASLAAAIMLDLGVALEHVKAAAHVITGKTTEI